jgi:hypothetical protein
MASQQYDYLIGKFEDGDFPNGQDFKDLIDSTYNFSLSDLPDIGLFLQSASGNWESTYQTYNTLSGDYATFNYINDNFLNLAGGIITGSLGVQQQILSGGIDLLSVLRSSPQVLLFNETNGQLDITGGNMVSLSALSGGKQELSFNEIDGRLNITSGNTVSLSALSGGKQELSFNEIDGRLNITGGNTVSLSALSGGISNQTLFFNQDNYRLNITNGGNVSLSSLTESFVTIPFTHSAINPTVNTVYRFGSMPSLQPSSQQGIASRQTVSQFTGRIVEASIILDNSNINATSESSLFAIKNVTKDLSASISSTIKYREDLDTPVTLLSPVFFNLENQAPTGWSPVNNTGSVLYTSDGGYVSLLDGGYVESPIIPNAGQYSFLRVEFSSISEGDNSFNPIKADLIINGMSQGLNIASTVNDGSNIRTSIINLTASNGINPTLTNNTKLKLLNNNSISSKRLFSVSVSGVKILLTGGTQNYTVVPLLRVDKNDLLEVIWVTPNWGDEPTDVVNLVTAKMLLSGRQI